MVIFYTLLIYNLHVGFIQHKRKTVEMAGSVSEDRYPKPVKIGIGTKEQHLQLSRFGCDRSFRVEELTYVPVGNDNLLDPVEMIFREEDTVVLLQPGILPKDLMKKICKVGSFWQVPGHDPVRLFSDDDRAAFRRQKPLDMVVPLSANNQGRPPKWPTPTKAQVSTILSHWYGPKKPAVILEIVRKMMGSQVPKHWVRDQVIKATGSASRTPKRTEKHV